MWVHSRSQLPLTCRGCGFESRQGHGYLCVVSVGLSGRGLCVGLIARPEESYRVWCVQWLWSRNTVGGRYYLKGITWKVLLESYCLEGITWKALLERYCLEGITWKVLPGRYYLKGITRKVLPGRYDLEVVTRKELLERYYLEDIAWNVLPGRYYQEVVFWKLLPGRYYLEVVTWKVLPRIRSKSRRKRKYGHKPDGM